MIFVTVGNATQGFRRLLDAVEFQAQQGILKGEEIVFQSGHTSNFSPVTGRLFPFIPLEEFEKVVQEAEVVICHAGAGTLIHVFRVGKVPVVMPRQKKHGEHVDDHQVELVKELAGQERVIPAYEEDHLASAIEKARNQKIEPPLFRQGDGLKLVENAIEEILGAS